MALRKAESELDIIYNFYLDLMDDPYCGTQYIKEILHGEEVYTIPHGNSIEPIKVMNYFLIDFRNKNGFPSVLPDKEYKQIKSPIVYRGVRNIEHMKTLIDSRTYHYGSGNFGNGIYLTTSEEKALNYTGRKNPIKDNVTEFKLNPESKMVTRSWIGDVIDYVMIKTSDTYKDNMIKPPVMTPEIKQKIDDLIEFINQKNDSNFRKFFVDESDSVIASYLGFDIVLHFLFDDYDLNYIDEFDSISYDCPCLDFDKVKDFLLNTHLKVAHIDYIVYNRGSLIISEKEKDRILKTNESGI